MSVNPWQAIHLALELGQPLRLWRIFQELMEQCQAGAKNPHPLDAYVKEWSDQEIKSSLGYLREWNTNAKHAPVAQVTKAWRGAHCYLF